MKKEIILSRCPLCGSMPVHQVDDMGTAPYQHYYGSFNYIYRCPKCGVINVSADTVYRKSGEEADAAAKELWNKKCAEWEETLSWRNEVDSLAEAMAPRYDLDALANYVTKTSPLELDREISKMKNYEKEELVDMLVSSKYNIFNPWYKKLLISINSPRTNDILKYYKRGFDKIEEDK